MNYHKYAWHLSHGIQIECKRICRIGPFSLHSVKCLQEFVFAFFWNIFSTSPNSIYLECVFHFFHTHTQRKSISINCIFRRKKIQSMSAFDTKTSTKVKEFINKIIEFDHDWNRNEYCIANYESILIIMASSLECFASYRIASHRIAHKMVCHHQKLSCQCAYLLWITCTFYN